MYLSFGDDSLTITRENEITTSLQITFDDLQIREVKSALSNHSLRFQALIGLKFIRQRPLLLIASETRKVTTIGLSSVYEIKRIAWVAVARESRQQAILKEVAKQLNEIQEIFVDGLHYYSQLYDLSLPYVFNKIRAPDLQEREYYNQFVWNTNLADLDGSQEKAAVRTFSKYCSRVVQGYLEEFVSVLPNNQKIRCILVSRRSTKKAGTRFYARGIDDDGCVANFVETEQIVEVSELVFTHLQIRGSVPAFFAQTGVNGIASEMVIERTAPLTLPAFTKHFQSLHKMYQRIFAVNLLSDKKSQEKVLSNFYEQLVYSSKDTPFLRYQFYDFHEECKNNKFQNSETLIEKLEAVIDNFGFTCYDVTQETILRTQSGVMRTNCLDCLDRTNYVQSRLALKSLRNFTMKFAGHQTEELISQRKLLDLPVNEAFPLLAGFNSLWADNGDSISLLYTSIPSTHTDITRTGQRTLFGSVNHKFRSLMRFYTQFTDHRKQNAINSLVTPTSPRKNQSPLHDFHTTLAVSFPQSQDQEEVTDSLQRLILRQRPTLIVYFIFAKQQTSFFDKLRCYFKSDGLEIKAWVTALELTSQEHGYTMIGDLQSQFCWLGVFCRKEATQRVSQIKKENLSKSLTSGEALLIKMKLETSSFIFAGVNCSSLPEYLRVFDQIHEKGFQQSKLGQFKSTSLFELDYRVVLGNTGARLKLSDEEIDRLRQQLQASKQEKDGARSARILDKVLDADELNLDELRYRNKFIRQYTEGPVEFMPTANRLLFWNEQGVILRVREYGGVARGGLKAVLDYEIGRGRRK